MTDGWPTLRYGKSKSQPTWYMLVTFIHFQSDDLVRAPLYSFYVHFRELHPIQNLVHALRPRRTLKIGIGRLRRRASRGDQKFNIHIGPCAHRRSIDGADTKDTNPLWEFENECVDTISAHVGFATWTQNEFVPPLCVPWIRGISQAYTFASVALIGPLGNFISMRCCVSRRRIWIVSESVGCGMQNGQSWPQEDHNWISLEKCINYLQNTIGTLCAWIPCAVIHSFNIVKSLPRIPHFLSIHNRIHTCALFHISFKLFATVDRTAKSMLDTCDSLQRYVHIFTVLLWVVACVYL